MASLNGLKPKTDSKWTKSSSVLYPKDVDKVAINSTSMSSTEKLFVNGDIKCTNLIGNISNNLIGGSNISISTNTINLDNTLTNLNSVTSTNFIGALTGNSGTATSLQTARLISNVSFDGTANITLDNQHITNGAGYYNSLIGGTNISTSGNTINLDSTLTNLNSVTSSAFVGPLTGNASSSSKLYLQMNNSGTSDYQVVWSNQALYPHNSDCFVTPGFTFRPDTCNLSATIFTGSLVGNASSANYATSAGSATNATNASFANNAGNAVLAATLSTTTATSNTDYTITFGTTYHYTSPNLKFNPSTSNLQIQGDNVPRLTVYDSTGATDAKYCMIENNGGTLQVKFATDNLGSFKYPFSLMRESASNFCDEANFQANNLTINKKDNSAKIFDFDTVNEVLTVNGDVGIGTTTPSAPLHISGNAGVLNLEGSDHCYIQLYPDGFSAGRKGYIGYPNVSVDDLYIVNQNLNSGINFHTTGGYMVIDDAGKVGIGGTNPSTPLHVFGFAGIQNTAASTWFGSGYTAAQGILANATWTGNHSISIRAEYGVYGLWMITASDSRIKKNIVELVDNEALLKFRQLKPCKYNYIDILNRGSNEVYGFISQEVKSVLPYASSVLSSNEYIPNIYKGGLYNNNIITFDTEHNLDSNGNIKLILHTNKEITCPYTIADTLRINIDTSNLSDDEKPSNDLIQDDDGNNLTHNIFVYGTEVDDFHTLNKDAIWTTAAAALQEVDRIQQSNVSRIQQLESELALIKQHLGL